MYKIIDKELFINDLIRIRKAKNFTFFFDIETYQYNEDKGRVKPTEFKNCIYSLAVGYYLDGTLKILAVPNSKEFFDCFIVAYKDYKTVPKFELIAHNNNKYDNHFIRHDLIYYYNLSYENMYINNATKEGNNESYRLKDIGKKERVKGVILEKRVKSRNNMELVFFINGIQFFTTDNFMKTHTSIATLGKKLLRLGVITEDELKTDYNYTKYNAPNDMTEDQAREYAKVIFEDLDEDELRYIYNDIIILAKSKKYYSSIFQGFSYDKITFTSNILESYNINDLTSFQLLKSVGRGKNKISLDYTDYCFNNDNFYDYLKSFYNGGLNFYNYNYIGQIIDTEVFGIDINSSYPFSMYSEKIPTYLNSYQEFEKPTEVSVKKIENQPDTYTLYRLDKLDFDDYIITKIKSRVIKQMLVKYYGGKDYININSYTIKLIENITPLKIDKLPVHSFVTFDCVYFGARGKIKEYYKIKTQGQNKFKMDMEDLYNIKETDIESDYIYTSEEVDISKLNLNGLYGIPALRPYFNLFRWRGEELVNRENGFINSQRNILFSTFVTSVSLYNLLSPFKYLSHEQIDESFLYCDTDSLYFKKDIFDLLPGEIFDPNNIGAWDIQNKSIDRFYILNHKKYAYREDGKIKVKAGGVPQKAFNLNLPFEEFIRQQFSDGVEIVNNKSIYNNQGTISIYPSTTRLELGHSYNTYSYNPNLDKQREELFKEAKEYLDGIDEEGLYIESNIGCFSITELYSVSHETQKRDLSFYKLKEDYIRETFLN